VWDRYTPIFETTGDGVDFGMGRAGDLESEITKELWGRTGEIKYFSEIP